MFKLKEKKASEKFWNEHCIQIQEQLDKKAKFHRARWDYCNFLMIGELLNLKDEKVNRIFDKYTCRPTPFNTVALLFPRDLKESELPKNLRLVNGPK